MMPALCTHYPDIELELHADDSRSDFAADDIDLAFRIGPPSKGRNIAAALPATQCALYASPRFLAGVGTIEQPGDIAKVACILRRQEPPSWSFRNRQGQQQTISPKVGLRVNTMELARAAAQSGMGVAQLPSLLAQKDVELGTLALVMPERMADPVEMSLLCRAARLSVPSVAAVRQYILDTCGTI